MVVVVRASSSNTGSSSRSIEIEAVEHEPVKMAPFACNFDRRAHAFDRSVPAPDHKKDTIDFLLQADVSDKPSTGGVSITIRSKRWRSTAIKSLNFWPPSNSVPPSMCWPVLRTERFS